MGNAALQAIDQNDTSTLSSLNLKECINNLITDRRTTLLAIACEKSSLEIVKILINVPTINVNLGKPPLLIACERGSEEIVKLLLNINTINVNQENSGYTALSKSCKLGNISIIKELLKHPKININLCSPLRISCKERNLEIIKILLKQSDLKIENSDLNIANRNGINLLEIKRISNKKNEIEYKKLILKKYEMDQIKNGIIVFKPYIVKIAPNLMKHVIENEIFLNNLNGEELHTLQLIIDYLIYGNSKIHSNNFLILFILNRIENEFINIKQLCIDEILKNINFDNLIDTIENLNELIERDFKYHSKISNENPNIESNNILIQLKEYCLDLMGAKRKHPDFIKIKKDSRFESFLLQIFDRDSIRNINVNEIQFITSNYPLSELYFENNNINYNNQIDLNEEITINGNIKSDIEININGKLIKCHKTILSSSSEYFQTYFTGNWSKSSKSQNDIYPEEVIYIIEYCYGIIRPIPPNIVIQVLKKAHEHEMKELYEIVYKKIDITIESFYDLIKSLYENVNLEMFKELRINLINFAVENYEYLNLLNRFKELPICMRDDLIEKMLAIKFINNNNLLNMESAEELDNKKRRRDSNELLPPSKERK